MKEENTKKDNKSGKNTLKTKAIKTIKRIVITKIIKWLVEGLLGIPLDWEGN